MGSIEDVDSSFVGETLNTADTVPTFSFSRLQLADLGSRVPRLAPLSHRHGTPTGLFASPFPSPRHSETPPPTPSNRPGIIPHSSGLKTGDPPRSSVRYLPGDQNRCDRAPAHIRPTTDISFQSVRFTTLCECSTTCLEDMLLIWGNGNTGSFMRWG